MVVGFVVRLGLRLIVGLLFHALGIVVLVVCFDCCYYFEFVAFGCLTLLCLFVMVVCFSRFYVVCCCLSWGFVLLRWVASCFA